VNGPAVAVVQEPAPVLRAPLRGSAWVAFNAFSNADHRRALVTVDGKVRIAQRFAIDWMCLGPDGRLFHSDPKSNGNFYEYLTEVLAVGDGRISDLKDGFPENAGSNEQSSRAITLDNVVGNYLIFDLGQGRFALYAHLQPGSLRVKLGDKVKAGDALARLGNSGNSDAPHLHFHLMDANSPLGAEGLPYELRPSPSLARWKVRRCWIVARLGGPKPRWNRLFIDGSSPSTTRSQLSLETCLPLPIGCMEGR
jgi:hypothetical protein